MDLNNSAGASGTGAAANADQELKARVRAMVESYLRTATLSHLRDGQAVHEYVENQADKLTENLLRSFKIEKRR